jgi:hypothetical protein
MIGLLARSSGTRTALLLIDRLAGSGRESGPKVRRHDWNALELYPPHFAAGSYPHFGTPENTQTSSPHLLHILALS